MKNNDISNELKFLKNLLEEDKAKRHGKAIQHLIEVSKDYALTWSEKGQTKNIYRELKNVSHKK